MPKANARVMNNMKSGPRREFVLLQLVQMGYNLIRNYLFSSIKDLYVIQFMNIFPYVYIKIALP